MVKTCSMRVSLYLELIKFLKDLEADIHSTIYCQQTHRVLKATAEHAARWQWNRRNT